MQILIVEDTPCESRKMAEVVKSEDLNHIIVETIDDAQTAILDQTNDIQLVLLDRNLGDEDDGIILLDWMRNTGFETIPVLIVSALSDLEDRLKGLSSGALAYATKPFDKSELKLQIRTLLAKSVIRLGEFVFDLQRRKLFYRNKHVHLTPKRFLILSLLAVNDGKGVGKRALLRKAWPGNRSVTVKNLETEISLLRTDLRHSLGKKPTILADKGLYYLVVDTFKDA